MRKLWRLLTLLLVVMFISLGAVQAQDMKCPKCSKEYKDKRKFCGDDGSKLILKQISPKCPKCGKVYKDGRKFCGNDGSKLVTGLSTPSQKKAERSGILVSNEKVPGQLYQFARLGYGFDSSAEVGKQLKLISSVQGQELAAKNSQSKIEAKSVVSLTEAAKSMGSNTDVRFSLPFVSLSLGEEKKRETKEKAFYSYLIANCSVVTKVVKYKDPKLSPEASAFLTQCMQSEKGMAEWHEKYGTHFVSEVTYGGVMTLVIQTKSKDTLEKIRRVHKAGLDVGVIQKMKVGGGSSSGSSSVSSSKESTARVITWGGVGALESSNPSVGEFIKAASGYVKSVHVKPAIISFKTRSYYDLVAHMPESSTVIGNWKKRRWLELNETLKERVAWARVCRKVCVSRMSSQDKKQTQHLTDLDLQEWATALERVVKFVKSDRFNLFAPTKTKTEYLRGLPSAKNDIALIRGRKITECVVKSTQEGFTESGVTVKKGDFVVIEVDPRCKWSISGGGVLTQPGRKPLQIEPKYGWVKAAGHLKDPKFGFFGSKRRYEEFKWGSLICFLQFKDQKGQLLEFRFKTPTAFQVKADGQIRFVMNDAASSYGNNVGSMKVKIAHYVPKRK